ncbi:MAG TPA: SDR family NAD(P)-dependent oxidoreductase [Solirubrobacteraceae bacterium]|nr:SDR family NAD(P)-dependent oxidoreductase [Solirubrobacteraceae bacterium]
MAEGSRAVLITGCSSGIGEATATTLLHAGWTVYATARRPDTLSELARAGAHTLALDVTDEASMRAAVDAVIAAEGAVGVLVNNAGYSQSGAVETVPMDAFRRQFETNVFGLVALTQMVLPGMREQGWGKIVNVGSMGGRLTFPGGGCYHATKYALEALSDALRFEVKGFGIDVVLIEPGLIVTEFGEAATASMGDLDGSAEDPYATFNASVGALTKGAYDGPMKRLGGGPERVARAIERAISRGRAPSRVTVTPSAKLMINTRRLMGDRAWDAAMGGQFPRPGATRS